MTSRRQGTNAALESYDETLSASYIAKRQAREAEALILENSALENEQSANEWKHENDDCGLHCMYLRIAENYRKRAAAKR